MTHADPNPSMIKASRRRIKAMKGRPSLSTNWREEEGGSEGRRKEGGGRREEE